jgi:vancomycin aglycone glucosyltransferase
MRVLLSTFDSRGGIEPLAALALALRERGAEAVVCAPPDCADRLAGLDVPLVPVGQPVRALVHGASPPSPLRVPEIAHALIGQQFEVLAPVAEGCDFLVASGVVAAVAGARSVAELAGIPSALVHWCPLYVPSPHNPPIPLPGRAYPPDETDRAVLDRLEREGFDAVFGDALNSHRAAAGLPPVDVRDHVYAEQVWLAADPVLAPWPGPAYVDVVRTGTWSTPDDRPLPAALEAFLAAGEPPVYAGLGSVRAPDGFAEAAVAAARAHGRRVVVGQGWAGLAGDGGDDCYVVGEVNQQALFRRVAAVVHHGGAGTTATAARAGAPQVVVPQLGDQPYWAARVAALGVGAAHDGPVPTTESLTAALAVALAPETRERAAAVAPTLRTDGAAEAADLLLRAAR